MPDISVSTRPIDMELGVEASLLIVNIRGEIRTGIHATRRSGGFDVRNLVMNVIPRLVLYCSIL